MPEEKDCSRGGHVWERTCMREQETPLNHQGQRRLFSLHAERSGRGSGVMKPFYTLHISCSMPFYTSSVMSLRVATDNDGPGTVVTLEARAVMLWYWHRHKGGVRCMTYVSPLHVLEGLPPSACPLPHILCCPCGPVQRSLLHHGTGAAHNTLWSFLLLPPVLSVLAINIHKWILCDWPLVGE
jgi:hypothetical protein